MAKQNPETLGLMPPEIQVIRQRMGREPNWVEWGIFSLNWSEHCSYKTSKPFLKMLPRTGPGVVVGPGQNAGVIDLGNGWAVAFKVESHNHPSAIEPFHGAATGVGGIIRDILSMGARPIALLDSLRFGDPYTWRTRWLLSGVVSGIGFYGNSIGVPTVGGEVRFGPDYQENPLVNAMCIGLVRLEDLKQAVTGKPGNLLILAGAPTGMDGIHGATFASVDLIGPEEEKRPNVQIGDPFYGKLLIEATLEALEIPGIVGLQDLGAGGLSTAPPEMARRSGTGIELDLSQVPLRTPQMTPYEIVLSESQERMVLAVQPGVEEQVLAVYRKWGLEAQVIGRVIEEPVYRVRFGKEVVADLPLDLLLDGVDEVPQGPIGSLSTGSATSTHTNPHRVTPQPSTWADLLLDLLQDPDIASKRWVYEQYDWSVQTRSVVGPGKGDGAVLWLKGTKQAVVATMDGNWRWTSVSPYEGAVRIVLEAACNLAAHGAKPLGITDCLNFANPQEAPTLQEFEQVIQGLRDAALALGIPVVSGNVSFYNQSETRRIPPTPVVGMVGLLEDLERMPQANFAQPGNRVYLWGSPQADLGGSVYQWRYQGTLGEFRKPITKEEVVRILHALLEAIHRGWIRAAHDVSEGGILVAIAEMAIQGSYGLEIPAMDPDPAFWLGEAPGRWIVEISPRDAHLVEDFARQRGVPLRFLGTVQADPHLSLAGQTISLDRLRDAYEQTFPGFFKGRDASTQ